MARLVKVARLDELPPGAMKTYEVEGRPVLLANVEGSIHAMGAICTHEEWDLSEGSLEGDKVVCAGHGAVWDLTTGKAEFDEELQPNPVYRTVVKEGVIFVELE
ncbi:MAG: Rieske 2Fe-2S domain-containing protein [Candidatus Caldarchaeum sp.]|nr:Rieske 2Fe-2S domain-containing protein [Candidatus Caldarchaeum sp.]MDW8360112.1 Rieske 2Fe-2S domain-containing protein [Candidatus Caldarchaeum sp.]